MSRLEHGTPEGYDRGCTTDTDCPAFTVHGMSCETAHYRHVSGERRYEMFRGRGLTSTQIAHRLGFIPGHGTATPKETPAMTTTPAPKPAPPKKPLTVTPVIETPPLATETEATEQPPHTPELLTTDKWTEGLTNYAKTARLRGIRQWCRDNGFPGVPVKGRIPQDALAAYDAAHQAGEIDIDEAAAEIVAEGLVEHGLVDELRPDFEYLVDEIGDAFDPEPNDFTDVLDEARERAADNDAINALQDNATEQMNAIVKRLQGRSLTVGVTPPAEVDTDAPQVDTDTPKSDTERPEWATVTISQDVERARNLTARIWDEADQLEEQLHQARQERDAAQRSMVLALRQWADGRAQLEAERAEHAYVIAQLDHELWATNQALIAARAAKYAIANLRRVITSRERRQKRGNR